MKSAVLYLLVVAVALVTAVPVASDDNGFPSKEERVEHEFWWRKVAPPRAVVRPPGLPRIPRPPPPRTGVLRPPPPPQQRRPPPPPPRRPPPPRVVRPPGLPRPPQRPPRG
ncbi:UNVERIFIED_CONTAM: hypothetical protein Sindi_2561800 [Sesamum indicum]